MEIGTLNFILSMFMHEYTITLSMNIQLFTFPRLDGLIQTCWKAVRVTKSARNTSRRQVIFRAFLNLSNFPNLNVEHAFQTN